MTAAALVLSLMLSQFSRTCPTGKFVTGTTPGGMVYCATPTSGGGGGTPGGVNGNIQVNNAGAFGPYAGATCSALNFISGINASGQLTCSVPAGGITAPYVLSGVGNTVPFTIDAITGQTANLQSWKVNGTEKAYIDKDGKLTAPATLYLRGSDADSSTAVGAVIDNTNSLVTAGARILSIRNNGTEKAYFNKDGKLYLPGGLESNAGSLFTQPVTFYQYVNHYAPIYTTAVSQSTSNTTLVHEGALNNIGPGPTKPAVAYNNSPQLTGVGDMITSYRNNTVDVFKIGADGKFYAGKIPSNSTYPVATMQLRSPDADGASALGALIDTSTAWSDAGAKLLSLKNNAVEKAYFDFNGKLSIPGLYGSPVVISNISATGTPSATTFLRGDGSWQVPAGGGGGVTAPWTLSGVGNTVPITVDAASGQTVNLQDWAVNGTIRLSVTEPGNLLFQPGQSIEPASTGRLSAFTSRAAVDVSADFVIDTVNDRSAGTALLTVRNQGSDLFRVDGTGITYANKYSSQPSDTLRLFSEMSDGGGAATLFDLDTTYTMSNAASRLLKLSVAGVEKLWVDKDGFLTLGGLRGTPVAISNINATGTPSATTFLRGDGTWNAPVVRLDQLTNPTGDTAFTYPSGTKMLWTFTGSTDEAFTIHGDGAFTGTGDLVHINKTGTGSAAGSDALHVEVTSDTNMRGINVEMVNATRTGITTNAIINAGGGFTGALTGNASTATALSTAGSANQFWKNGNVWGQPDWADLSGKPATFPATVPVSTATALSTAGSANQFWKNGNVWGQPAFSDLSGSATTAQLPTIPVTKGGTNLTTIAANQVWVGTAADTVAVKTIPSCSNATTSKLLFDNATQTFSCGTDQTSAGGGLAGTLLKLITTDYTNSTTTPSNIFTFSVPGAGEYGFSCMFTAQGTTTSLPRYNINGPSATNVSFMTERSTSTSAQTLLTLQAFSAAAQTAACTTSCNATNLITRITGSFTASASGTLAFMGTSSTAAQTVTVRRGSYCVIY